MSQILIVFNNATSTLSFAYVHPGCKPPCCESQTISADVASDTYHVCMKYHSRFGALLECTVPAPFPVIPFNSPDTSKSSSDHHGPRNKLTGKVALPRIAPEVGTWIRACPAFPRLPLSRLSVTLGTVNESRTFYYKTAKGLMALMIIPCHQENVKVMKVQEAMFPT